MGRPLKKDVLGVDSIGTPATTSTGIRVEAYIGGAAYTDATFNAATNFAYIVKQRGATSYVVTNQAGVLRIPCIVQADLPNGNGEMRINGYTTTDGNSSAIPIRKLTKRVATDFSGNRYTWVLENDSTSDYIVLTAI
tara:strand:+ start:172 stop:582 length:411 start_codon:yes stop_codon:yes gene_type:complete